MLGLVSSLNDVFFLDETTGWAVGEQSTILHTGDAGATWQRQVSPVSTGLRRVVFVDAQNGWIIGTQDWFWDEKDTLLRTTDGGQTWEESPLPLDELSYSADMAWVDATTGWLTTSGRVFHTTDGGETWEEQALPSEFLLYSITCVDDQHAWIAAGNAILRTTDGGQTWAAHEVDYTTSTANVKELAFVDTHAGWGVSRCDVLHTGDGGQTWELQLDASCFDITDVAFVDAQTGWVAGRYRAWHTMDGGDTWVETGTVSPSMRRTFHFVDTRHGWSASRLSWKKDGQRSTIAYTEDGGATWQIQDTHIEMPPLAYTTAARLTPYLTQHDPPLEILLLRLVPTPCGYEEYDWMLSSLRNLGWLGDDQWGDPLLPSDAGYQDLASKFQRIDADVDNDGVDEIVLYGGGAACDLLAGVMDWDGTQWQAAWYQHTGTRYNGNIRVYLEDLNGDGQPELFVETLNHPVSGTGFLSIGWDLTIVECEHLHCAPVWSETVGSIARAWNSELNNWYTWSGSDYRFVAQGEGVWPGIEVQEYGVRFDRTPTGEPPTSTLEMRVLTATQTTFHWDGGQYTPTVESILEPGYTLDVRPVTETVDLDGDGTVGRFVQRWVPNADGLWQRLAIYTRDAQGKWQSTRVFTAGFTGIPSTGISLEDVDGDDAVEIVQCTVSFHLQLELWVDEWPSTQPHCIVYHWDPVTRTFTPQMDEE
jgi:photosystem II stability/assembly factor-like uncharacterized protein